MTLAEELILLETAVAFCHDCSSVRLANATRMVHCDMMNESTNLQQAGVMYVRSGREEEQQAGVMYEGRGRDEE